MPPQMDYRLAIARPVESGGTLRSILDFGDMHDEERQKQAKRQQALEMQQEDQLIQQVLQKNVDNPDNGVQELKQLGRFNAANKLETQINTHKTETLKRRGLELDLLVKQGQIDKAAADSEKAAMAATDPFDVLPFIENAGDDNAYQLGIGLAKYKFGAKADPIFAQLPPTWTPEVKQQVAGIMAAKRGQSATRGTQTDLDDQMARRAKALNKAVADLTEDEANDVKAKWFAAQRDTSPTGLKFTDEAYIRNYIDGKARAMGQTLETLDPATTAQLQLQAEAALAKAKHVASGQASGVASTSTGAAGAGAIPPQARSVLARVITGMPGTRVGPINAEVSRLAAAGDEAGLKSFLRYAATQKVGEARQTAMQGRMETLTALKDAEALLKTVPTGYLKGTWENTARALGKTSDPRLVELGTRMSTILAQYMRSISGAAVSDNEAARLAPLIPNYKNDLSVNLGTIKGFSEAIKSFDKAFYQNTFGENYDWVMSNTPSGGGQKPAGFSFKLPDGRSVSFPSQQAMDAAKREMGIK